MKKINVLMFGWEFPPLSSGGRGTSCYGLTKGLSLNNVDVTFVVPCEDEMKADFVRVLPAGSIKIKKIKSILMPYMTSASYDYLLKKRQINNIYGFGLFEEVYRYSEAAKDIAKEESFDIIHCHDWMTYRAGINAKEISGKPLVLHIHATEFDRTGDNPNQAVCAIEKEGFEKADRIIAVSNYTKNKVIEKYGISPEKIEVVHNAVEFNENSFNKNPFRLKDDDKVVLFLGRITIQKGPDYFIYAAKKVLEHRDDVKFIVVGSGDMENFIIEKAAELGIANKVLFTGALKSNDVDKAYQIADVYVMPSVSEPFGITPLEAMRNNTPVIISKQSGVSEVIKHCLEVDFWDINELSNKIIALLDYGALHSTLKENASEEVKKFNWDEPAKKCINVYNQLVER